MLPDFPQLCALASKWMGYSRGETTDCGGYLYSFHNMIPLGETMEFNVDDVSPS